MSHAGKNFCVAEVANADAKLLQAVADALKPKFHGPIFLAGAGDGSVALIAVVPKELTAKFQANKLIQEIAPIVGGKGGGRPESAARRRQGRPSKCAERWQRRRKLLSSRSTAIFGVFAGRHLAYRGSSINQARRPVAAQARCPCYGALALGVREIAGKIPSAIFFSPVPSRFAM